MQLQSQFYQSVFVAECADHSVINGDVAINDIPFTNGQIKSAVYSCLPGYRLNGLPLRLCYFNRHDWLGKQPTCIGIIMQILIMLCYLSDVALPHCSCCLHCGQPWTDCSATVVNNCISCYFLTS